MSLRRLPPTLSPMMERAKSSLRYGAARTVARLSSGLYRVRPLGLMVDVASLARLERTYGTGSDNCVASKPCLNACWTMPTESAATRILEFGVYQGRSLRWWADHLAGPDHVLVGFDSFEGLPEEWNARNPAGHFDRGGAPPTVDDPRASYPVGWFADTLVDFDRPETESLIINVDCDLYSSTKLVLDRLAPGFVPVTSCTSMSSAISIMSIWPG